MRLKIIFFAVFSTLMCFSNICAQGYVDFLPDNVKNPFIERRDLITKELEKPIKNEWAGVYSRYVGETWSEWLALAPQNGFAAFRDTCSYGPRAWVNYGSVDFRDGLLTINSDRGESADFVLDLPGKAFMPIKWGEQHWPIPTDKLDLFAYAINSRAAEEYEAFYIKGEDIQKPQKGQPDLPPQYKRLLGMAPIRAKVIKIGVGPEKWYPEMTLDVGKREGVIVGMSFWLSGMKGITVKTRATEVEARTSTVEVIEVGFEPGADQNIEPKPGWRFTSRYNGR